MLKAQQAQFDKSEPGSSDSTRKLYEKIFFLFCLWVCRSDANAGQSAGFEGHPSDVLV